MMDALKRSGFILLLLNTCFYQTLLAQIKTPKYEIAMAAGFSNYMGDLTPSLAGSFKGLKPSIAIAGMKLLSNYLGIRGQLLLSKLNHHDAWYQTPAYKPLRNFNFTSSLSEFSITGVYTISGANFETYDQPKFNPYITAGIAVAKTNITRNWSQTNPAFLSLKVDNAQNLAKDNATTPPRWIFALPFGVGIRTALHPQWSLTLEGQYRLLFTDYLDGFSYAANPKENDGYYTIQLGIIYRWSNSGSVKCPRKL